MTHVDAVEILLVEDNPQDVELTVRVLKKHRVANQLLVVRDGAEALDFVFGRGAYASRVHVPLPKLVLLDLKLPKVDGLEVLRQIKSNERAKVIPVVVLTSSREERDIVRSYRLGANSYLVKPVDFDQFIRCVSELGSYWLTCNEPPRA